MARRTGKYAGILGKLPKFVDDTPYQDKVNERKREMLEVPDEAVVSHETAEEEVRELMKGVVDSLAKVNSILARTRPLSASGYARTFAELRGVEEILAEWTSETNLNLEALKQLMESAYENEDVSSLRLANGDTVRSQPEPYSKVVDKDAFRQWAIKEGLERSLQLPWQTTNALTKERLLKGLPEPTGVTATVKTKWVLTRA